VAFPGTAFEGFLKRFLKDWMVFPTFAKTGGSDSRKIETEYGVTIELPINLNA